MGVVEHLVAGVDIAVDFRSEVADFVSGVNPIHEIPEVSHVLRRWIILSTIANIQELKQDVGSGVEGAAREVVIDHQVVEVQLPASVDVEDEIVGLYLVELGKGLAIQHLPLWDEVEGNLVGGRWQAHLVHDQVSAAGSVLVRVLVGVDV